MNFAIDSYCLVCFLQRNIELVRPLGPEEKTTAFAKKIMQMYLDAPAGVSAPWFGPQVADLLHEMYGLPIDRFCQEKIDSNRFILERMDHIREKVEAAPDPVFAGLQFAIQGNYLDFAALRDQVSFDHLDEMLDKAKEMVLDEKVYADLCADFEKGKTLLYLTDNAGGSSPRRSQRNIPICRSPSASGAILPTTMPPGRMPLPWGFPSPSSTTATGSQAPRSI